MLTDDTRHIISVEARSTCDLFSLSYKKLSNILVEYSDVRPMLEQAALNRLVIITQTVRLLSKYLQSVRKKYRNFLSRFLIRFKFKGELFPGHSVAKTSVLQMQRRQKDVF